MRTIPRLYDSYDGAKAAVKSLDEAGIPSDDISIVTKTQMASTSKGRALTPPKGPEQALVSEPLPAAAVF